MNREEEDKKRRQNPMVESIAPLLGYSSLSIEERKKQDNEWLEEGLITPKTSIKQKEIIYNNDLFMQATNYDIDRFNALDYDSRNALTKQIITSQTLDKYYSDDPNYNQFKDLDSQGLIDLFNSDYQLQSDINKQVKDYTDVFNSGVMSTPYGHITTPREFEESLQERNTDIAKNIVSQSRLRSLDNVKPLSEQFFKQMDDNMDNERISSSDIDEQIEKLLGSYDYTEQVVNPIDGSVTTETRHYVGSPVYNAYKDQREMKNFTTTEKMHTLAEFYALQHEFQ